MILKMECPNERANMRRGMTRNDPVVLSAAEDLRSAVLATAPEMERIKAEIAEDERALAAYANSTQLRAAALRTTLEAHATAASISAELQGIKNATIPDSKSSSRVRHVCRVRF